MDQSRRRRFRPSGGRGCLLLSSVVMMTLAGCESGFGSRKQDDPMLGGRSSTSSPTPVPPLGAPENPPTQTAAVEQSPPLPASYTASGPAAVAAGVTATSDPGRNLRIPGDSTAGASGNAVRGVAPGVTVGNPEPTNNGPASPLTPLPSTTPPGQSLGASPGALTDSSGLTFDQALRLLKQYGVSFLRLDMDDGLWKFECSIPNPKNATVNRHYMTTRGFPDQISAIREVLAQIEKDPH